MEEIDIRSSLECIVNEKVSPDIKRTSDELLKKIIAGTFEISDLVKRLSGFVIESDAYIFKKYFSNILLALVSAKIPLKPVFSGSNYGSCSDNEKINHLKYSIALAYFSDHPDILQYTLKYFEVNNVPPFEVFMHHEDSYNVAPKKRRLLESRKLNDYDIVKCCHTLLTRLPNEFSNKWDWSSFFVNFYNRDNLEIRWMVRKCIVILTNMTQAQSKILLQNFDLTEDFDIEILNEIPDVCYTSDIVKDEKLNTDSVVNIDGILLPLHNKRNVQIGNLVPVKSTVNNLRSLALAVASGHALSLTGPVGSGKTSLVDHLAAITGRKGVAFKKVQLGDQTDSRMLLGSHQCTDVPGEFVWRPGVLTEAVQNGHWLLLEDIDCAALDVASTLSSLLERNTLCVPGYRDALPVTPGFQLFVTQRTLTTNYGFQKKMSNSSTLLQKHLTQINVEPLSRSELSEIIQTLYPTLSSICSRMIEVFMMFSVGSHDDSLQTAQTDNLDKETITVMRGSRLISTRDLIKWCARSVVGFDISSPESALKVLQDALDIFTCSVPSPAHRLELAKKVGTCLGIVETKSEFYCKHYKPNVSLNQTSLDVGRAKVARVEKTLESIDFNNKQVVFSFTKQSACLLEKIACCVTSNEPVLLVGETGTGKTSSVQYLARQTGHKLVVINMNQQSDSADLLGGYKPVDLKYVIRPIKNEFENLFRSFYNVEKNKKFLGHIDTCFETENWNALLALMKQSHSAALKRITTQITEENRLKLWKAFGLKLTKLEQQVKAASKLTFAFIEGSLVKAMQEGHWVLLDEINLASAEILECLAGLLEDKNQAIDLIEKGDKVPIKRHSDFTLFACMNPATDVGKKDLPVGLRNRFTEFFIDELTERNDLMVLIGDYLYHMNLSGATLEAIYSFYASIRKEAKLNLVDGAGNAPHYSLRTLCRALIAAAKAKCGTVSRSLFEAFCLSFLTQLDSSSHPKVEAMIAKAVIGKKNVKSVINQLIPEPGPNYLLFEGHWIPQGKLEIDIPEGYILTPTVRKNLRDIARIISLGRLPVLLQGDTSVGKTSLITYIAKASGNYCVRINNHEHTDLQEYIGSYAADASGKLVFKEGVLVEAMRKGYWIILDELNLAPSDVLEALNRVLDDNRELFIPETQQVVKADTNFMLFATQNPPGLYGGRKMMSRAFRNRFVELHFDEIPKNELETILHQRCHVPPAYSKKMIAVMADLQIRRRGSAAVQGKDGFITLRDLFRWGQRYKRASKETLTEDKFYDWEQHIADEGYLILAGKVRQTDERVIIEEVIEKHIKRKVTPENLFSLHQTTSPVTKHALEIILNNQLEEFSHVVWTYNMRRLAVLIAKAFDFDEPVLLVGETGCGKTTICQVLAALKRRQLLAVNCHMHTESSDFLGGLRPVRQYKNDGRLFEWMDGPLIKAMEAGDMFLADEISLADDSVLERLNSLLEPERQLVISERGMEDNNDIVVITAEKNFHFIGTMNPGGDFGKKELSPALRNRFTEIWCDSVTSREDLLKVLEKSVHQGISLGNQENGTSGIGDAILNFTDWLKKSEVTNKFPFSIRDLLSWVQFINVSVSDGLLETPEAYVHGACMTFLDCFGTALTGHVDSDALVILRNTAMNFLLKQIETVGHEFTEKLRNMWNNKKYSANNNGSSFGIDPFYIEIGSNVDISDQEQKFTFTAPTTGSNTLRLLRGMQLRKAILLEGNPGVGKTSLVTALAKSSGHKIVRINLSDQTDITDLFGTDLPTVDGAFCFKEGAFLSALQNSDWIILDELNLAPQSVLEGLNACLDHRGEVFIPELGKTFKVNKKTRIFACQNPLKQGGARRGLPVSFLNRFTQVYIDTLTKEDLIYIVESQYSSIQNKDILHRIVSFNCKVAHEIIELQSWAHRGGPWEMNLRDIQRWCEALIKDQEDGFDLSPGKFVDILYVNRMRTAEDKEKMIRAYDEIFLPEFPRSHSRPMFCITDEQIMVGDLVLTRNQDTTFKNRRVLGTNALILRSQLPTLKALAESVKMNWLSILVGPSATGKSTIVQILADLTGNDLQVVPVTSAMDVSDLLGGFEQVDYNRNLENICDKLETLTLQTVRDIWLQKDKVLWTNNRLLTKLHKYKSLMQNTTIDNDMEKFKEKIHFLLQHCESLLELNKSFTGSWQKLHDISSSLKQLQARVSKATSVNAGGKFEWVDSLLVKSMVEGSWLLLDNVNLTSAAVLDRLNGLLEHNGVLSIPERGDISDIKPHPNFRVFFTMDPKFGEISRAMRNRGVEIYLLRPEDWNVQVSETMPPFDLRALLSSCGLPYFYHELCIQSHELMASYVQGFERPTISHLLQAAHLISQQLLRGISISHALVSAFLDVYIKPRSGCDFASTNMSLAETKNSMLEAVKKILNESDTVPARGRTKHTLTVKDLCTRREFNIAEQISSTAVQHSMDLSEDESWQMLFCVLLAYRRSPVEITPRVQNAIYYESRQIKIRHINEHLYNLIKKHKYQQQSFKRFYPELFKLEEYSITKTNVEELLLFDLMKQYVLNKFEVVPAKVSANSYSQAVLTGTLTDDFVEYPILKHCKTYIDTVDKLIQDTIGRAKKLDDRTACHMMQLLNYRDRFLRAAVEINIFVQSETRKTQTLKEEIVAELYLHSNWLQKRLVRPMLVMLDPPPNLVREYENVLKNITIDSEEENSNMAKVNKAMRGLYGQPTLYENKDEFDLCNQRTEVYNKLSLNMEQPVSKQLDILTIEVALVTDSTLALDVPDSEKIITIQENLAKILETAKDSTLGSEVKLLPIASYVIQRVLNVLKTFLLRTVFSQCPDDKQNEFGMNFLHILKDLIYLSKVIKGFPAALINLLEIVYKMLHAEPDVKQLRTSSVPTKLWDELYKALVVSPAYYPLPFLTINQESEELEDIPTNTKRLSPSLPLVPFYVRQLTVANEDQDSRHVLAYKTVSLENRTQYSALLSSILNILFKNMGTLATTAQLQIVSDLQFEIRKYKQIQYFVEQNKDLVQNKFFVSIFDQATKAFNDIENTPEDIMNIDLTRRVQTAELSLWTSLLFVRVMSEVSSVDHVEKCRLKKQYIEEDVKMFNVLLSEYFFVGLVNGTMPEGKNITSPTQVPVEYFDREDVKSDLKKVHPHCAAILDLKQKTLEKVTKYALGNTFRPDAPTYTSFAKDCKHFTRSVLSADNTTTLANNLIKILNMLLSDVQSNSLKENNIRDARTVVRETTSWLYSVKAFYKKVGSVYSEAFPDIAKPLQTSLSQIVYSVTLISDLIKELLVKIEQGHTLADVAMDLMVFPDSINKDKVKHLTRFLCPKFLQLLSRNVSAAGNTSDFDAEFIEVLKMNLSELRMDCAATDSSDTETLEFVVKTLDCIVDSWEQQQRNIEKKKQDDEALYVTKSKCEDEDEEAMNHEEIQEMFPSYSDQDFAEFKPPTLEQIPVKKPTNSDKLKEKLLMSPEDVSLVYKWHSNFVRCMTAAEWLPARKKTVGNDVVSAFLQRYPIFSRIIMNTWEGLDAKFEGAISPGLLVLISEIKAKIDGDDTSSKPDFYRSPWVSEARQCVPLLHRVRTETNALLDQWPDFPTLKEIIVIVNRILNFPVTSPVSRFLTGLELLRDKIEEWNKNAHKGNNMIDVSLAVGQQIVNWRKLEMAHWKECLNNLYNRKQSEAHKYWFYLYSVVKTFLREADAAQAERVTAVLRDFMEKSNLAEYEVRLDIVYVYHLHLVQLNSSPQRDQLLSILWNIHNYYSQFSAQVAAHIKEKRAPIEKKLRDFVKICSWDRDLSYWSVKDTVEKAHKALHKHTKEFENVLKESVTSCLVDSSSDVATHVGIWDRPKRATASAPAGGAYLIDPQNHVVLARNIKHLQKYLDQSEQPCAVIPEGSLLSKVPSLLNKAKSLCKDTINNSGYPALVQGLDDFVTLVIETSTHLGSLEVDPSAAKDKQTLQAKNFVQQKRKALADLFKYLTKLGLNYRTGLVVITAGEELYDFTIPPVNLEAAIGYLKSRRCDASLALLWSGCEKYFQKNIARHRLLSTALLTPHQDLGIQNIERCKGFAAQLMKLTNTQKESISKYSRQLCDLRNVTTNITNALEIDASASWYVSTIVQRIAVITDCLAQTSITLEQFSMILKSLPEKELRPEYEPNFDAVLSDSKIVHIYKNSEEWRELNQIINSLISTVNKQKAALHKLTPMPQEIGHVNYSPPLSQAHVDVASDCEETLENISETLSNLLQEYQFRKDDNDSVHPMLRSILELRNYLLDTIETINNFGSEEGNKQENACSKELINETEDLVATMLLIIQSVYKRHLPQDQENIEVINAINEIIQCKEPEESKDVIQDKHLKEHLQEKLSSDTRMLQLDTLNTKTYKVLNRYVDMLKTGKDLEDVKNVMMRLVPILEQTVLFVQYFVTQKVAVHRVSCKMLSILLKIFSDLAKKGFCRPSDVEMDDGEGEGGPGKLAGGTGLGDGEGQKDVSDRIENQDQLDDAHRPGEEQKEEERDCKEEQNAVNMTDDFDSHLQDVEKKDGETSDQDDEEDDADKQMGDIDNAAEKLDQQIWGSEDEEDIEEDGQKKDKEEKGKGESTGEKEMAAKEQEQGTDDGVDGQDKKKKKDINEMDEPEVDDDHVDPYHGNQQPLPEPEDFELPDNMDIDGDEPDDKDGETETENPFEIDVMKENIPEEEQKGKEKEEENRNGLDVSSDEEGDDAGEDSQDKQDDPNQLDVEMEEDKTSDEKNGENEAETPENGEQDTADNEANPEQAEEENKQEEELPQNKDKINEEDEVEQKNQETNPQANPSNNDPTAEDKAENAEMDRGTDDNVETNPDQAKNEDDAPFEQAQEQVGEDKQSTGRSELDKSDTGHRGQKQAASHADKAQDEKAHKENKPGRTDQERTLGDVNEKKHAQSRTLNTERDEEEGGGDDNEDQDADADADAFQHVKQANKDDLQAIDAATKEQADLQPTLQQEDEEAEKPKEDEEVAMDVDDDELQVEKSEELKPEKIKEGKEKEKEKAGTKNEGGEEPTGDVGVEVEGDTVLTEHVPRGADTTYHSRLEDSTGQAADISLEQYMSIREWVSARARGGGAGGAGAGVWRHLWLESAGAARALCERLRLVLEPTGRSRRAGDFRTGRAINMRRVIPYIASHFRKDRIWLRRTKPAKREYKIAIAVDDSSSMSDNRSKELAFESLALVSQALNLLESGELAVISFGEKPNLLHPFTEQFSEHSGANILEQLRFDQTKTKIAQLLDFCSVLFDEQAIRSDAVNAKLLVIVSDGRGIFSEGESRVVQAVRRARQQGIFLVYVIIDNPDNKDSIMDIRRPIMDAATNSVGFVSYLDTFPFPFYLVLRDMAALPNVLGDALRQWFELAANSAS